MALSKKISALTAYTNPIATDLIPIVDVTSSITKKISYADLGLNQIYRVKKTLSSAQILALNGTPITAVAAPGAGYVIRVISALYKYNFNTLAYLVTSAIDLITDTATAPQFTNANTINGVISRITDALPDTTSSAITTNLIDNKALFIKAPVANPTTGNGTLDIYIYYVINPL